MSLLDKMMSDNLKRLKGMQKEMLDMQEEIYDEDGEQIERLNKKRAELGAAGTKIHYQAAASGVKEAMSADKPTKFCHACGHEIDRTAKYCSECGAKQS